MDQKDRVEKGYSPLDLKNNKYRYTLHYLSTNGFEFYQDDYRSSWQTMDFKTLRETKDYFDLCDKGYVIDNTNKKKVMQK